MKNEDDVIGNEITGGGSSSSGPLKSLLEVCPICGKEFSCNKTYHVYTALAGRRRQYYCSYHCFKQRPNPKNKLEHTKTPYILCGDFYYIVGLLVYMTGIEQFAGFVE